MPQQIGHDHPPPRQRTHGSQHVHDLIIVQKDEEKWEISRDAATKVTGELKVGAKVTIEYRMAAAKVDVKKDDGTVEEWMIEAGTPNTLLRRGFTKESLQPGTEIVVDGYQAKDGERRANGRDVTLPNGKTLFLGASDTGAPK